MARPSLSTEEIKARADRAEGIKQTSEAKRGGRPPKYNDAIAKHAEKLCVLGATNADLADFFEVSIRTIERWTGEHEEFTKALAVGKEQADARVERSLYQRAVGYTYDSEKVFQFQGEVVRAPMQEHCPPDVTAQIFWLKNRKPAEWRDRIDLDAKLKHSAEDSIVALMEAINGKTRSL